MVAYLSAVLLLASAGAPPDSGPSESDLKQARQLLMGVWEVESIVDNGEKLGAGLIRKKVAAAGRITVGERMIRFQNPITNEDRITAYRLNPSTNPRQIDVINDDDRLLRGIYRFEGDQLVVCLQHQENGPRPERFEAPDKSSLVVLRMNLVDPNPPTDPAAATVPSISIPSTAFAGVEAAPVETPVGPPVVKAPAAHIRTAKLRQDAADDDVEIARKPTEAEIRSAHELLYGTWTILAVERDGEKLGEELIRDKVARDARVVFGDRTMSMVSPRTGHKSVSSFTVDPGRTPHGIDVVAEFDNVQRGIYKFEGDELWVCLNEAEDSERPTVFDAPPGSRNLLMRLRAIDPMPASAAERPKPPPPPSPAELAREREANIRKMLVGSWTVTDSKGTLVTVLEPDGRFVSTRNWSRATKRLFFGKTTTSSGRWTYANGWVRVDIYSSNDPFMAGRSYYQHVDTIGPSSLVGETMLGQLVSWNKLQ